MNATLYFLCGLPFAGKSTLARALAAHAGARLISLDAVNEERGLGQHGAPITPAQWDATYAQAYRRVAESLAAGQSVVYDETCFLRGQRDAVRAIASQASARAVLIWVSIPLQVAHARWRANRANPVRPDVRDEDFAQVSGRFEPPGADESPLRYDGLSSPEIWLAATGIASAT